MQMMEIRVCSEKDYPQWEAYIRSHPRATPFHQIAWLNVVRNTYGHEPNYLIATEGGRVLGVLPLFSIARPGKGVILASGAFTSYDGVLGENLDVEASLMDKAAELAMSGGARWCEVKNTTWNVEWSLNWHVLSDYCTMIVPLDEERSSAWAKLNKSTRKNVRRSERDLINVESGHQWLSEFYDLELLTMRRHGTPVHSKEFYSNILREFSDQATVFVAKREEMGAIAAKLVLMFRDRMYSLAAASNSFCRESKCSDFLSWQILKHASMKGFKSFDFGRSVWNSGTFEFKQRMGAVAKPLYYSYVLGRGESVPLLPQRSIQLKVASAVWRRFPLQVTALLGPKLIRYVP